MKKIRVWDLPVRLFHWLLAILIVLAVITEKIGGNALVWHFRIGYALLALVCFRILWGIVGSHYARFSNWIFSPSTIVKYIWAKKGSAAKQYPGHNPLGSLSVLALLIVILAQAISGLFANDDIASEGPLAHFISKEWSDKFTWFHATIGANLIYFLVGLHLTAIAYYVFWKKENLPRSMVTGDKQVLGDPPTVNDSARLRLLALAIFAACILLVYLLVQL